MDSNPKWKIIQEPHPDWVVGSNRALRITGMLVVPDVPQLKRELFDEAHRTRYTIHPGTTKMYKGMRRNF